MFGSSKIKNSEKKLIESFQNKKFSSFLEQLYFVLGNVFANYFTLIKKILNFNDDADISNEIIVRFMENKFNFIKLRFSNKNIDEKEFLAFLYISIKHTIIDILYQNSEIYRIKQILRKQIINIAKKSDNFDLIKIKSEYYIKINKNIFKDKKVIKPKNNLIGINLKDVESILKIILKNYKKIHINIAVNKFLEYLLDNNYITIQKQIDIYDLDISDSNRYFEKVLNKKTARKVVDRLLDNTTYIEQRIFYMYFIYGYTLEDISKATKISKQLVFYYKNKLIKLLKLILEQEEVNITLIRAILNNFMERVKP